MLFEEKDLFEFIEQQRTRLLDLLDGVDVSNRYAYLAGQLFSYRQLEGFLQKKINKESIDHAISCF